jgi:hypothetical protein
LGLSIADPLCLLVKLIGRDVGVSSHLITLLFQSVRLRLSNCSGSVLRSVQSFTPTLIGTFADLTAVVRKGSGPILLAACNLIGAVARAQCEQSRGHAYGHGLIQDGDGHRVDPPMGVNASASQNMQKNDPSYGNRQRSPEAGQLLQKQTGCQAPHNTSLDQGL